MVRHSLQIFRGVEKIGTDALIALIALPLISLIKRGLPSKTPQLHHAGDGGRTGNDRIRRNSQVQVYLCGLPAGLGNDPDAEGCWYHPAPRYGRQNGEEQSGCEHRPHGLAVFHAESTFSVQLVFWTDWLHLEGGYFSQFRPVTTYSASQISDLLEIG